MTSIDLNAVYNERKESFNELLKRQKRILSYISILRLAVIIVAFWFIVLAVKYTTVIFWPLSGLMFVLFFVLVSYHKNQNDKKKLLEKLVHLNEKEEAALNYEFSENPDGKAYFKADHPWSYDLDLFGEGSFFQYINRTATHPGPGSLANYLTSSETDSKNIAGRQNIIKELSEKINLRQHFTANASIMDIDEDDYKEVIAWSDREAFIEQYNWTKIAAYIMTFLSLSVLVAGIFNSEWFRLLLPLILVNLMLLSPFFNRTNKYQVQVSKKHSFLKTYSILLDLISNEKFENPDLAKMAGDCTQGSAAIKQLSSYLNLFDQRLNLLVGFVLNALFLFDFYMLHRLARWNREHKEDFENWLRIAGDFDALTSLGGFAYNHPSYVYPEIDPAFDGFLARDLGHPLIPEQKRVANSIEIKDEKVVLITGANMAGKSTFLRSVGVNMVLAYSGCPVCATSFKTGNFILYSSMRTSDSLKDDESYFFAEIKRLKFIVDEMEAGKKLMILLDEVLKGTNTTDKQKGSKGLIEKSLKHDVLCFIATHDLSLGELQEKHNGQVVNYCFESYIKDLELSFDYKIMPGLAKNMNASFLMKKMGIMD